MSPLAQEPMEALVGAWIAASSGCLVSWDDAVSGVGLNSQNSALQDRSCGPMDKVVKNPVEPQTVKSQIFILVFPVAFLWHSLVAFLWHVFLAGILAAFPSGILVAFFFGWHSRVAFLWHFFLAGILLGVPGILVVFFCGVAF